MPTPRSTPRPATQVAKAAGARYAVTGSFADFYGKFRINARVVDAETGEILKVVSNDDPKLQDRAQLAAIVQLVGERIVPALGLPPLPADVAARRRAVPTDALTEYSRGLLFEGRGDARQGGRGLPARAHAPTRTTPRPGTAAAGDGRLGRTSGCQRGARQRRAAMPS